MEKHEHSDGHSYNFSKPIAELDLYAEGQPIIVNERIFKDRVKNGFYVEAGAFDGEYSSNSLYFEIVHGWNGLLIEPNPDAYQDMLVKVQLRFLTLYAFSQSYIFVSLSKV